MEVALRNHLVGDAPLASLVADRIQWAARDSVSPDAVAAP